ncbi:MAG TPA: tetratricopeptide repeat protein [Polyangiaceae bacterium]|nr:tetratricopeptide repeat protein [Polyangiaceae bacterium]
MAELPRFLGSRFERSALVVAAALLTAIGFLPQFGGPGYESALAGGLVLPSIAAVTMALVIVRRPLAADGSHLTALACLGRGVSLGAVLALTGAAIATLHGLRAGFCDAPLGYELWATGPGPGAVMGGAWGAAAGLVALRFRRRRQNAVLLALLGPLGGIAIGFWRFYTSPMVFGFDPFVGYFAGPLYDTVVDPGNRLISYRIGSLATLLGAFVAAYHLELDERHRLRLVSRGRPGLVAAGALALGLSIAITLSGPRLGHYGTTASIEAGLGRSVSVGRCLVVYSAAIPQPDAERVGRECTGHLPEVERYLGAHGPEHVKVFLFASDAEKGAYMGATHTYIAKPWRGEVYVQAAGFPHPTLGHELAHVVSGSFGTGPFRVAGPLGGLIPDPGRIEGVAVAASPGEDDDFTLLEWSRALLDLQLLPDLGSVFRLGFLAKASSTAYTVAGAFVSWLHDHYGAAVVRAWYSGQPLAKLTGGKSLAMLDREFRADLARISLRPELLAMAKARFDRPSIFGRVCPRRIDRDLALAEARLGAGDTRGAREAFRALLELEPANTRARFGTVQCDVRDGELDRAVERYQALANDPRLSVLERASVLEARGDALVMAQHPEAAIETYEQVRKLDADEDRQRTLEVKVRAALARPGAGIRSLLIGDPKLGPSWDEAAPRLGAEAAAGDPLAQYLVGRNLWIHGRARSALEYLNAALDDNPTPPRSAAYDWPPALSVVREALRLRLVISCSDPSFARAQAKDDARRLAEDPGMPAAKKEAVGRFALRCGLTP